MIINYPIQDTARNNTHFEIEFKDATFDLK